MAPQTKGAETLYRSLLKPLLMANKDRIEQFIAEVKGSGMEIRKAAIDTAKEQMGKPEHILRAAQLANQAQAYASEATKVE